MAGVNKPAKRSTKPAKPTWPQVAQQFIAAIPFHRISGPQAFDLACDIVNAASAVAILRFADLGQYGDLLRLVLVLQVVIFAAWSYRSNQPG